jgi:hypothetical protein
MQLLSSFGNFMELKNSTGWPAGMADKARVQDGSGVLESEQRAGSEDADCGEDHETKSCCFHCHWVPRPLHRFFGLELNDQVSIFSLEKCLKMRRGVDQLCHGGDKVRLTPFIRTWEVVSE